jgi:MOSC domain-containing protein YiiM
MFQQGTIVGLFCGDVATFLAPDGRPLTSAIRKSPIANGFLTVEGFRGDASAEPVHHTADKAMHLFADENYSLVEARLGVALPRPTFGENLIATGIREEDVYVGEDFQVGETVVCVTQPTERCRTIGRSIGLPKMLRVLHELEVCGFYARVVKPGRVVAGDPLILRRRPQSAWSIKRLHRLMFRGLGEEQLVEEAMAIEHLSDEWKSRVETMRGRLRRGEPLSGKLVDL